MFELIRFTQTLSVSSKFLILKPAYLIANLPLAIPNIDGTFPKDNLPTHHPHINNNQYVVPHRSSNPPCGS